MTRRGDRRKLGPDELFQLALHLSHELTSMTRGAIKHVQTGDLLFQEAGLLHMRALLEFFVGRDSGRKGLDVWPSDFGVAWPADPPGAQAMRGHLTILDQWLSHMSLTRGDPNLQVVGFGAGPICIEVLQLAMDFAGSDADLARRDLRTIELAINESIDEIERAELLEQWVASRPLDPRRPRPFD